MKVLLVDDHPLFVEGLKNLLIANGVDVIATACDGLEALEKARVLRPEIVLMDLLMAEHDGMEGIGLIKEGLPDTKVVVLTMFEDSEHLLEAIRRGASGYLLKSVNVQELFDLLLCVARGETVISRDMASIIMRSFSRQTHQSTISPLAAQDEATSFKHLTTRQVDILQRVMKGQTNREIAMALGIGERTVQYHMSGILRKFHLCNRAQVVAYAQKPL